MMTPFASRLIALTALPLLAASAAAAPAGNPARGRIQFLQCAACHSVAPGAPHKLGPNLDGIADAPAASRPGYSYSDAFRKVRFTWTEEKLAAFLEKPSTTVPGTKMLFGGIHDPVKRADLVAYLQSLAK